MTRAIVKRKPNNKQNTRTIRQTVGLGLGLIASEHFFSSMLTSPMTTKRFFSETEEGREDTIRALRLAIGLSLSSGAVLSYVSKSWLPVITTGVVSAFYWFEYNRALRGEI